MSTRLAETVSRVVAPNASHMTLDGTNTYVVGEPGSGAAFVVDPGPGDEAHFERVRAVLQELDAECSGVVVTHHHLDHSEAALAWGRALGTAVAAASEDVCGPEGWILGEGDVLSAGGTTLTAVPTPGHSADHLCFRLDDGSLLSGDHILGRGTSVVAWPEGDLAAYLDSLRRVLQLGPDNLFPGHGPELTENPDAVITFYLEHRAWREAQVRAALLEDESLSERPADLVARLYAAVDPVLWPAAEMSTRACLVKLAAEGVVSGLPFETAASDGGGRDARHPLG
ncbi:MAG TPA: MBL fold metallo-hydrolase [Acidimicrobiales bacterium]|nr:MBL fold metallo-hydrolase [Acidimicrobiales bacterium]